MEKHQFKPFEPVLVRDSKEGPWRASFYSYSDKNNDHVCISGIWNYCIPYNEETAHLLGTNNAYNPPQPKQYHITWIEKGTPHKMDCTEEEFKNFIETAVLKNKDIQNFNVKRI